MSDDREEDAFRWEGDEELERITSLTDPLARGRGAAATGSALGGATAAGADTLLDEPDVAAAGGRAPRILVTVVFAVLLLAEVIGWLLGLANRTVATSGVFVIDFVRQLSEFIAVVGAAVWFVAVTQLTRDSRLLVRFGWLALGLLLFLPWNWLVWR